MTDEEIAELFDKVSDDSADAAFHSWEELGDAGKQQELAFARALVARHQQEVTALRRLLNGALVASLAAHIDHDEPPGLAARATAAEFAAQEARAKAAGLSWSAWARRKLAE